MNPSIVEIWPYDPAWPRIAVAEQRALLAIVGSSFVAIEHIGSTAIPGLAAKPVIDLMAALSQLADADRILPLLYARGYQTIDTGMPRRIFLRRRDDAQAIMFHLHLVERATWDQQNERLLRDELRADPALAAGYGRLKQQLATQHPDDMAAYTRAKTDFIQSVVDRARAARGLPWVSVWEE